MTHRETLLTVLRGGMPGKIPWAPRLDLWFNAHRERGSLPSRYSGWSLYDIHRDLRLPIYALNGRLFREEIPELEQVTHRQGSARVTEYRTPIGSVYTRHEWTADAEGRSAHWYQVEHMIKTEADYDVVQYMVEHTRLVPTYETFSQLEDEIGSDGLAMGYGVFCPLHQLIRLYTGYERVFMDLHDRPSVVDRVLDAIGERYEELQELVLASPAEVVKIEGNLDAYMTNPKLVREYFVPALRVFAERLHRRGKLVACHADGEMTGLLELVREIGFDVAEAFTPAPMTRCTLREARAVWKQDVTIWGGLPAIVLSPEAMDDAKFDAYVLDVLTQIAPGNRFILGVGDNVPPEGTLDRVMRVQYLLDEHGNVPLSATAA